MSCNVRTARLEPCTARMAETSWVRQLQMKDSGRGIPEREDSLLKKRSLNVTAPCCFGLKKNCGVSYTIRSITLLDSNSHLVSSNMYVQANIMTITSQSKAPV